MREKIKCSLSLMVTTIIWGSAFIAQSVGMDFIGPFTFQAIRCGLAVLFLILLSFLFELRRWNPASFFSKWKNPRLWITGFFCGLALFAAASLQQIGLIYTSAGKAGFITAMYIVLVPICGLCIGKKPPITAIFSIALAVLGLYMLSCAGTSGINKGDLLMLGGAFMFAVQITLIDELASELDGIRLNCVQSLVCGVISCALMMLKESPDIHKILPCWIPLFYAGILSSGVAYSIQIVAQKGLEPTTAALIMSLESVFAALFGWLILHEVLSPVEFCGCLLVFSAVVLSQIPQDFMHRTYRSCQK